MDTLLSLRSKVHTLLEQGRRDGVVKSSLTADVSINVSSASTSEIIDLLGREGACILSFCLIKRPLTLCLEHLLKSLFGTSGVSLCDRTSDDAAHAWQYKEAFELNGQLPSSYPPSFR